MISSTENYLIGWSLLLSGFVFILSFVFLALMFTTRQSPWGSMNDVSYVIALMLIIPVLIIFYKDLKLIHPISASIAFILCGIGILIIATTQMRLVFGNIEFELNLRQGAFGSGLFGLGFLIFHLVHLNAPVISSGLTWLGLASGVLLAAGIPTGLFYGKEELVLVTGKLDWKQADKLALTAVLSAFIGQIALIVWVFWLGIEIIYP